MLTPTNVELVLDVLAGVVVADDDEDGLPSPRDMALWWGDSEAREASAEYIARRRNADFDDGPETAAALAHVMRRLAMVAPPRSREGRA